MDLKIQMDSKKILFLVLDVVIVAGVLLGAWLFFFSQKAANSLDESEAIALVQNQYPEFADFSSDSLPPRSILAEKNAGVWFVAFVQEGSGRPLLWAKCFSVDSAGTVLQTGEFKPEIGDTRMTISPVSCR